MPRIPRAFSQSPMPTSPGLPRGGTQVPVVQQPTVGEPGPTMLERSLQGPAQTLGTLGRLGLQMGELEQHRQRAQDVLDATLSDQETAQRLDRMFAEQQQTGRYQTMPETVMEEGRRILEDVAQERQLSPQARALYQARVQERLTVMQQKALAWQTHRREQDTVYAQSNAIHEALQSVSAATTPYEEQVALGRLDDTLDTFQATGLGNASALADLKAKARDSIKKNKALVVIRGRPLESYGELHAASQAIARGETPVITTEAFRGLTAGQLAELTDDAWQHLREEGTYREHAQAAVERQRGKDQEAQARMLFADLTSLSPIAQNLPAIERQIAGIHTAAREGRITYGQQQSLMSDALQWKRAAQTPPAMKDDPAVESLVALKMLLAVKPEDYWEIRRDLVQNHTRLTPETLGKVDIQLRQRESNLVLMQDEAYRAGRQLILDAAVPEAALLGMPGAAAMIKEEDRQRLSDALRAFEGEMQPLDSQQRQVQWRALAQDVITNFVGRTAEIGKVSSLPTFLMQPGTDPTQLPVPVPRDEAIARIQRYTRDDAFRGALLRRYNEVTAVLPSLPEPAKPPERRRGWFGGSSERRK